MHPMFLRLSRLFHSNFTRGPNTLTSRHMMTGLLAGMMVCGVVMTSVAYAAPRGTGLPLPRFVSLRASEVNLRAGPGVQYPVEWVYTQSGLPVEIIAEYRTWRKIRDWQGTQGWVHQSMLASKRAFVVVGTMRDILKRPTADAQPIARAEVGVIGTLMGCPKDLDWCKVEVDGFEGWLGRSEFWGILRGETF